MKLYIIGPPDNGDGVYHILTEDGEHLASHYCSNMGYARGDLESRRPERQEEWKKRFGDYEVLTLGEDDMTQDELVKRNHALAEKEKADTQGTDLQSLDSEATSRTSKAQTGAGEKGRL